MALARATDAVKVVMEKRAIGQDVFDALANGDVRYRRDIDTMTRTIGMSAK